ncbi:MAG: hypothetical protein WAK26_15000 [Terracidiphilus sp.]
MILHNPHAWEISATAAFVVVLLVAGFWLLLHKGPTPEERERARRLFLSQSGRLVDGMLLDICEVDAPPRQKDESGRTLTLLVYKYRIGGVDYESSQDITDMPGVVDAAHVRVGFPCSARYQPGNPQNSIVLAEDWSGLRQGLPVLPAYDDPDPLDTKHLEVLRPGRNFES